MGWERIDTGKDGIMSGLGEEERHGERCEIMSGLGKEERHGER